MSIEYFEKVITEAANSDTNTNPVIAVIDEDSGNTLGILHYDLYADSKSAVLWYIATDSALRNTGVGGRIYQDLTAILKECGVETMVFEVEIPEIGSGPSHIAARRISWYQRQGAILLGGYNYLQSVDTGTEPVPMYLMAQSLVDEQELTPEAALNVCQEIFEDALTLTGKPHFINSPI